MLMANEVKLFLGHAEEAVRDAAVEYLGEGWARDPDIAPRILAAASRHGDDACLASIGWLGRFAWTVQTCDEAIERLVVCTTRDAAYAWQRALVEAPAELLRAREALIGATPQIAPEFVERIRRRVALLDRSPASLWEELRGCCAGLDAGEISSRDGVTIATDLVEAIGADESVDRAMVLDLLGSAEVSESWLGILLVALAGRLGLREAVPLLVDKLHDQADFLTETTMRALARIGDPATALRIAASYADGDWSFRLSCSRVLGLIKHPECEQALLDLLPLESDPTLRTSLCSSLCGLMSLRGIDVVRREIAFGYDRQLDCLEERLLAIAPMLGVELPEEHAWRRERDEREQRSNAARQELAEMGRRYAELRRQGIDPFARLGQTSRAEPVRAASQTGRNDPCPCGSGRKFKKCCLGREAMPD